MKVSLRIKARKMPACLVCKIRRKRRSEYMRLPTKLRRSISTTSPSKISKIKSTRLSLRLIIRGETRAARRPAAVYASAIFAASCSAVFGLNTRRSADVTNKLRASSLMRLLPSKLTRLIVGRSTTVMRKVLPAGEIATLSNNSLFCRR